MKITTVEYRRLRTFDNYQNETVGAVAEVGNEEPADVLETLKLWVNERLGDEGERANLREAVNELERRREQLVRQIDQTEKKWAAVIAFLGKLGIERPGEIPSDLADLPF